MAEVRNLTGSIAFGDAQALVLALSLRQTFPLMGPFHLQKAIIRHLFANL